MHECSLFVYNYAGIQTRIKNRIRSSIKIKASRRFEQFKNSTLDENQKQQTEMAIPLLTTSHDLFVRQKMEAKSNKLNSN